jgi:hypothetical protein
MPVGAGAGPAAAEGHGEGRAVAAPAAGRGACGVTRPVTQPGWYRAAKDGLELVAPLDDPPEETWDLVKVEVDETMTEEPLF